MPVFRFSSSIEPGATHRWWTGGGDYYTDDHFPQLDARPRPRPGSFEDDGNTPALVYKEFSCSIVDTWPYKATYFVTVENPGSRRVSYDMRVYVP